MPTTGFSIKPLKVKLSAGEQKATEFKYAVAGMKSHGAARHVAVVVKAVLRSHFGVGDFTHFRTYANWDVHWGYDLDFDAWPSLNCFSGFLEQPPHLIPHAACL